MSEAQQTSTGSRRVPASGLALAEMRHRLLWLINLRWLAIFCAAITVLVLQLSVPKQVPVRPLWWVIFGVTTYNALFVLFWQMMRQADAFSRPAMTAFTNVQIALDLVAMALFVYFAGGVVSLFLVISLFPVAIVGSLLLGRLNCFLLALLAAVLLNVVAWAELYGFGWIGAGTLADLSLYHQPCYILAICIVFTLSILVTVYVASSISSSLRQREAQLEQTYRQLAALDEEKSFFMRKVSHELRSPLAAIRSCLSVALEDLPTETDSHAVELIGRAERRSRSLLDMVTDLLKFSRMREGVPLTYDREPVNLAHLAESVIESFAERAREKDITLTRDIKPVRLAGSEDALQELLANLIGNAIKYTPSGGSVTVSTCPDGDSVVLVVSDSGIGIEPEALGGIFEEFSRTERGRTYDATGTGMGLAIVKRVVDLHGGTIHLESEPDKGSTVTVRLPVKGVREDVS